MGDDYMKAEAKSLHTILDKYTVLLDISSTGLPRRPFQC